MIFKEIAAEDSLRRAYNVQINPNFINYIVPSQQDQVGEAMIVMAKVAEEEKGRKCASVLGLDDLIRVFPNLKRHQLYDTAAGKLSVDGLVNMERVMTIDLNKRGFFTLTFVDGTALDVDLAVEVAI